MQHLQPSLRNDGEAASATELRAPPAVADPNPDVLSGDGVGSVRFSDMTVDSDIQTPALQTATMAWPVHEAAGQVEVPSIPRSTTRGWNPRPGPQNEGYRSNERAQHPEGGKRFQYEQGEQYLQYQQHPQDGQGRQ